MRAPRLRLVAAALGLAALAVPGCGKKEGGTPASAEPEIPAAARAEAQAIYAQRCVPCHGEFGHGDGPASATLSPKPRNLRDTEWQKSVTDEHIDKIIQYGGAAVGKSAGMPPNPDLGGKRDVIVGLRAHVRGFGRQ